MLKYVINFLNYIIFFDVKDDHTAVDIYVGKSLHVDESVHVTLLNKDEIDVENIDRIPFDDLDLITCFILENSVYILRCMNYELNM
jgi:hypothetical protein